ncbi:Ent-kaur-16-ene synthase [Abeliophyllum distichum]|uniref:Ent-kaur-16-ene synthase n=1 Tax=Abeliophyllum distichum TaxID=126358 RepID=A0ABD1QI46_9LAMI
MSIHICNSLPFRTKPSVSASLDLGVESVASAKTTSLCFEEAKERITKLFHKAELSVSSYDTAWVAMVPSPHSSQEPCFPECVNWLLENQLHDGSWALPHHHSLLRKDIVSSTLACVLALKRWGIGDQQINRGVHFIELHFASATVDGQLSPVGYDIIFPGMLEYARDLSLNLCLDTKTLNDLIHKRDLEIKRFYQSHSAEREAYLAYISEGMGELQNWESVMKYQRRNGSLFNCPSTTASAFTHLRNPGCLNYLQSALKKFGNAVPAVYPLNIFAQLCLVDNLQRLGIGRHFMKEIQTVLDETHRCWLQGEEEIFMEASTSALAFRLLRMNGYDVSSDLLTEILEAECFSSSFGGHKKDINMILESYGASEMIIHLNESALGKQNSRFKHLLEQKILGGSTFSNVLGRHIDQEVKTILQYPFYATLERIANRRSIENYKLDNTRILKTAYCSPNFGNKDFLLLSALDFNICQTRHRKELEELERWVIENRLDKLSFARQKSAYCYFSAAATIFTPELSDARMSWAKNGVLTTVVDDFFDVGGSVEELKNLIQLVETWDVNVATDCCSEKVGIIFSALKSTICKIGDKGFMHQERSVTNHIIDIWLNLLHSMLKETEWARDKYVPTMDEYMSNAYVSFALGPIVLPTLYFTGHKLSDEMVHHFEVHNLFKLMSTCGRLLNDIQSFKRESKDGKLNALSLYIIGGGSDMAEEAAIAEMKRLISSKSRELLRLVLHGKNSALPKACKDLFWHMCTVLHLFYNKDDGFTSDEMISVVNAIIHQPIVVDELKA